MNDVRGLILIFTLMAAQLPVSLHAKSLLAYGGFELLGEDGLAHGWSHNAEPGQLRAVLESAVAGGHSQRLEFDGPGKLTVSREVSLPGAGEYFFSVWVKSDDRVVCWLGDLNLSYVRQGEWQRLSGIIRTRDAVELEIRFKLGGLLTEGPSLFELRDLELRPTALPELPQRKIYPDTVLTRNGEAEAIIVYPAAEPAMRGLAEAIRDAVKRVTGVELALVGDAEACEAGRPVLRPEFRDSNLILLGRLGTNRALWPAYNRWLAAVDGYYPGGDGYVVRTAANVMRNGKNHLIVGGSSDHGVGRAAEAFIRRVEAQAAAADGTLSLPWLLEVELDGDCLQAFEANEALWQNDPWDPQLPPREAGYGTVRRWYENVMGYYWSGWDGYRHRALEYLAPILEDDAYTHHYVFEHMVRVWDMIDDSGLYDATQRHAMDSLIMRSFWEGRELEGVRWQEFSPPLDSVLLTNRHDVAPWQALLMAADFLHDYFDLSGELAALVDYSRAELHGLFHHMVSERWGPSPGGIGPSHSAEVIHSLFRYALDHEVYEFFSRGHARQSVELGLSPVAVLPGDMLIPYAVLASYEQDGQYLWLLEQLRFRGGLYGSGGGHFMNRYFNGVRRYTPGAELTPEPPAALAGVRLVPVMPHWRNNLSRLNYKSYPYLPEPFDADAAIQGEPFMFVQFYEGFRADDDFMSLAGTSDDPFGARANPGSIRHFSSRGRSWLVNPGSRYFDQNAIHVQKLDGLLNLLDKPYPATAAALWHADLRDSGGVGLQVTPHAGMDWQREVIWLRSGLYLVRDRMTALADGSYRITANWHTGSGVQMDGDSAVVTVGPNRLRLTPLDGPFGLTEGARGIVSIRQGLTQDMKTGDTVEMVTLLQAMDIREAVVAARRKDAASVVLQANDSSEAILIGWGPLDHAGIHADARLHVVGDKRLTLFDADLLRIDGRDIWQPDNPSSIFFDWEAGTGYTSAAGSFTFEDFNMNAGELVPLAAMSAASREGSGALDASGQKDGRQSVPAGDLPADGSWAPVWHYVGLQRPTRITGFRAVDETVIDFGREVDLVEIRHLGNNVFTPGQWPLPAEIWTAVEPGEWQLVQAQPIWQQGVRTGNYGRGDPVEKHHQVVRPAVRARYVKAEGARALQYFESGNRSGRVPYRLQWAGLSGNGDCRESLVVLPDVYPYTDRGTEASLAVIDGDGVEQFRTDIWPVPLVDVQLLDYTGDGCLEIVLVTHDSRVTVLDGTGRTIKEVDLYALHEDFQQRYRRSGTRHPAGGLHTAYTIGLWRRGADGVAKMVLPRYGNFSFVDEAGNYEGVLGAGEYVQPRILPYGIDFNEDGIEEQVAIEYYRLIHIDGAPEPEVRPPAHAYWPQVYSPNNWREMLLPHDGGSLEGSRVELFQVLAFGDGRRYVLIVSRDYMAIYDARLRQWVYRWVPAVPVITADLVADDADGLSVLIADRDNNLWKLTWRDSLDRQPDVHRLPLKDTIHRIRVAPGNNAYALLCGERGLYLLDDFRQLDMLIPGRFSDARFLPGADSALDVLVAVDKDGEVTKFERR